MGTTMKKNIFTFTVNEGGREKFFILGIGSVHHILVCSSMASALELHDRLERAFAVDLKVLGLEGGTTENFEANLSGSASSGYAYKFVYEGTAEYTALLGAAGL